MNTIIRFSAFFVLLISAFYVNGQNLDTRQAPLPCVDKTFSVIAHIVLDSLGEPNITEEAIQESIDSANSAFSPICIGFEICEFRIIPNFQFDTLNFGNTEFDELQVQHHVANRINMFFITDFETQMPPYVCGSTNLGGITELEEGGLVIRKGDCMESGSKTVPHELGHFFGLLHTFEGNREEFVNGSNCATTADMICDTPSDPFLIGDPISIYIDEAEECRFILPEMDANGEWYAPDVGNYMNYYPSECACGFTHEQYLRMAETFLSSSPKAW